MPKSSKQTPSKDHRHSAAADPTSPEYMAPPSSLDSFLGSVCSGIKQRVDEEVARRISESTAVSTSQHEQLEDEVSCLRMEVTRVRATLDSRNVEMASLRRAKGVAESKLKKWVGTVAQWIKRTMKEQGGVIKDTPDFGGSDEGCDNESDGAAELLANANAEIGRLRARLRAYEEADAAASDSSVTEADIDLDLDTDPDPPPAKKKSQKRSPVLCEAVNDTARTSPARKSGRKIVAVSSPSAVTSPVASPVVVKRKGKENGNGSSEKKRKRPNNPYAASSKGSTTTATTSSSSTAPQAASTNGRCKEVIRGKDRRRAMQGYDCAECEKFFNAICENSDGAFNKADMLKQCSRHKSNWVPTQTPPDFWEMGFMDEEKEGKEILTQKRSELKPMQKRRQER